MTDSSKPESKAGSSNLRQLLLIGLLVLLVIGLIYDYTVARPGVNDAYDKITEQSMLTNMSSTNVFTNTDVQDLLKKAPSRTFEEPNGDFVEVYSWRSGLPIRTHDLFAVFKKNGENWMFHRHSKYKHEPSTEVSKYDGKDAIIITGDGDPPTDGQDEPSPTTGGSSGDGGSAGPSARGPGGGGPGGGGPGGGGPGGGGNFDPEAMFNENDADGDGFLAGDEIMERARGNLAEIDTDGDEKISKEEWNVRVEAMRARGGGRGGAGGGGGQPRGAGSRPEVETEEAPAATDEQ